MAACEGSHFFIRYAEVWLSLTDLCVVADFYHGNFFEADFTTDFHGFRHGISQIIARVWAFC